MAAVSANAARALEQVKMGLYMLYGADYFTEEEWIKVDGLIHKGQYVFTRGPPDNLLEEPLLSFEDSTDETQAPDTSTGPIKSAESQGKESILVSVSEVRMPSPASEEASTGFPVETPLETSAEASSDEELPPPSSAETAQAASAALWNFSEMTESIAQPIPESIIDPITKDPILASQAPSTARYTQEQLDEVKAFNASLTKAGQKKRPKYDSNVNDSYPSPEWSQEEMAIDEGTTTVQAYPSPTPTDREQNVQQWADEVHMGRPATVIPTGLSRVTLADDLIRTHGRSPRPSNDFSQPNNPQFRPKRPESRTSTRTARSSIKSFAPVQQISVDTPRLKAAGGEILIALNSHVRKGIQIHIQPGDRIKYGKHVSGAMHYGQNLRTMLEGQFPETIFDNTDKLQIINRARESSITSNFSTGLDKVEGMNAAEWDEVPVSSRPKTMAPAPVRPAGGLANSRFAALADVDDTSQASTSDQVEGQALSREEIGKMLDEKFAQMMAAQQRASVKGSATNLPRARIAPLGVPPKTDTCWFWAVSKEGCRFEADQCRDLHAHLPSAPRNPVNLHQGKPTWGALADYTPTTSSTAGILRPNSVPAKLMTCWYWAHDGKCNNSAEDCKYLHEYSPHGTAYRPRAWKKKDFNWTRKSHRDVQEHDDAGASAWGNNDDDTSAWGEAASAWDDTASAWGDPADRYKPPHVKALDEKAKIEAIGW